MKIVDVQAFAIRAPNRSAQVYWGSQAWERDAAGAKIVPAAQTSWLEYPPRWRMRSVYSDTVDTTVVRLTTDTGLVGYGEAKAPVSPEVCREIVHQLLRPLILGNDPLDVRVLWERMYGIGRLRSHMTGFFIEAVSGVDIALWDLAGKALGVPIYQLLGGAFQKRIPVYASGLPGLKAASDEAGAEQLMRSAVELAEQGFQAAKVAIGFGLEADVMSVKRIRQAVGASFLILADAAGVYDVSQAIQIGRSLEGERVGFLEGPVPPENISGYVEVSRALALPVACDLVVGRMMANEFLRQGAIDVIQPDVCRTGGITECRRVAELADVYGVAFAPHMSIGSAIQFAATAQVAAAVPNLMISEYWIGDNPLGNEILRHALERDGSYLLVPDGPGLGIEIDEEMLLRYAVR